MADVFVQATDGGFALDSSSALAYVDVSARADPLPVTASLATMSVQRYSLNRGRFVIDPLVRMVLSVSGSRTDDGPDSITRVAQGSVHSFWDPTDVQRDWPNVARSAWLLLVEGQEDLRVFEQSLVDRECGLRRPAVLFPPGAEMSIVGKSSPFAWIAVAIRMFGDVDDEAAGDDVLFEFTAGHVVIWVAFDGGQFVVRARPLTGDDPPVVAGTLSYDTEDVASVVLWVSLTLGRVVIGASTVSGVSTVFYEPADPQVAIDRFVLGGSATRSMLVYGVCAGSEGDVSDGAFALLGVLSCR